MRPRHGRNIENIVELLVLNMRYLREGVAVGT